MTDIGLETKASVKRPYQKVADQLLDDIAGNKYAVGARLPSERRLAEQFDVGRPVIREAIIALEILNAVIVKPNSGIYVAPRTGTTVPSNDVDLDAGPFELLEARILIEGEIAYLAATALTDTALNELDSVMQHMREANDRGDIEQAEVLDGRFHEIIVEGVNNSVLYGIITDMRIAQEKSPLSGRLMARIHGKGVGRRIEEHNDILAALNARDPNGARSAMRRHVGCVIAELAAATEFEVADPNQAAQGRGSVNTTASHRSIIRSATRR